MRYDATIIKDGNYADLTFTKKDGQVEEIYLGSVKDGALADQCLGKLYDYHQCDDEFKDGDEIVIPLPEGQITFEALSFHIVPADEETKFACLGVTKENPYRVSYDGIDGNSSKQFPTLEAAAAYVKERWQGVDYMDGIESFHTDYARYALFGFRLTDIGKLISGANGREFEFHN